MRYKCINIENDKDCCGCRACENICPQDAITMEKNQEGFYYPKVNYEKCVDCGLCSKVCPMANKIDKNKEKYLDQPKCYAVTTKNEDVLNKSTSGGMFYEIAKYILDNNGVVYGSTMDKDLKVKHIAIGKIEDMPKIMGSKYVNSDLGDCFKSIRKQLNNKQLVLFSGVPCQCAALQNYLLKDYDNLITVEVVCHGTPNQDVFDKYIKYLENKEKAKVVDYKFRSKEASRWGTFRGNITYLRNSKEYKKSVNADFDKYYTSFLNADNYRESCYVCPFANKERYSDFTLGDFWGIENIDTDLKHHNGVSSVIINTNKGVSVFERIKCNILNKEVTFNDVSAKNTQLKEPSVRNIIRNIWYENFNNHNFIKKIKIKLTVKKIVKLLIPSSLKQIIKNLRKV